MKSLTAMQREYAEERRHVWHVAMQWATSPTLTAHTSGSTGEPHAIELPMSMVRRSAMRTIRALHLDAGSRLHSCVSARFIGGKMMVVRSLELGCRFTFEPASNRPLLTADRIDLLAVVPSMMWDILRRAEAHTLPQIGNIIIGGAPIAGPLRRAIAACGLNAFETYGMTETASHIALRRVDDTEPPFTLLDGISIDTDARGCLVIAADGHQPVVTNDVVEICGRNEFRVLGRADNVIITGGRKVYPEEIERRIAHLLPGEFIITSRPSDKWGEEIALQCPALADADAAVSDAHADAAVSDAESNSAQTVEIPARLREAFEQLLAPHERPRVLITEALRHTPNGKIKRRNRSRLS